MFREVAIGTAGVVGGISLNVVSNFISAALKSWLNGRKIKAKLGDRELQTPQIPPKEFLDLARSLMQAKTEAEIPRKILEQGISVTIINNYETKIYP
jgi:hypothetical protein